MKVYTPSLAGALSLVLALLTPGARAAERATEGTFTARGVKLHYLVQGHGTPVVLVHGLYSSAEVNWKLPGVMDALSRDHQVIALDMPGHGQSDRPEQADAYGRQMAEDVVLLMDSLHVPRAHLVGYSMGGMVVVKLLTTHPDRVLTAVVGGMGWLKEGSPLQRFWERIPDRQGSRTPSACVRGIGELAVTAEAVRAIRTPLLLLVGERDPVERLYVEPMHTLRPEWPIATVPGAGHLDCILKPEFKDEIVKWLGKHP